MRWPWKRRGITRDEANESKAHLAEVRATEPVVEHTIAVRRATKNRNGFGPLFAEALPKREKP